MLRNELSEFIIIGEKFKKFYGGSKTYYIEGKFSKIRIDFDSKTKRDSIVSAYSKLLKGSLDPQLSKKDINTLFLLVGGYEYCRKNKTRSLEALKSLCESRKLWEVLKVAKKKDYEFEVQKGYHGYSVGLKNCTRRVIVAEWRDVQELISISEKLLKGKEPKASCRLGIKLMSRRLLGELI